MNLESSSTISHILTKTGATSGPLLLKILTKEWRKQRMQCYWMRFKLIGTDECGIRCLKVVMRARHRTWLGGNHGNPSTIHHLAPVTWTKSMENTYLDHISFILTKEEGGLGIKVVKRLSARDNTYGCHMALQAIRWPCKLWGAPTVSKHARMYALTLTLPNLHL